MKVTFSTSDQIILARRMSALLGTGMNIIEAFYFVERSMVPKKKKTITSIIEGISHGRLCSEILKIETSFDRSFISMIEIGEKSASLETAFAQAAMMLEKRQLLTRKIYGAFVYPGFIAFSTAGIATFLVMYIFPKIIPVITSMNIPLPILTKILIVVSGALVHHWIFICFSAFVLCLGSAAVWKHVHLIRRLSGILLLSSPLAGSIFLSKNLIQIFRPLGLLLAHGEHIPEALMSIAEMTGNEEYAEALRDGAACVTRGESFASFLSDQMHLFPQIVADFMETGEKTGGIAAACEYVASLYEMEVDESVKHISTIIEPALMLGMGIIVGGIALSIVMPIYEVTSYLSK